MLGLPPDRPSGRLDNILSRQRSTRDRERLVLVSIMVTGTAVLALLTALR